MAVTSYTSGSIYTDQTGLLFTGRCKVAMSLFNNNGIATSVTLHDGTGGGDPIKVILKGDSNKGTHDIAYSPAYLVFNTGIYCSAISASCALTLILTSAGSEI
jgi:hypothetical protein